MRPECSVADGPSLDGSATCPYGKKTRRAKKRSPSPTTGPCAAPDDPVSDRERPKRSWRDIDARREGSSNRTGSAARPAGESPSELKASKAHRAALDALFAKGEVGKYAEKMGLGNAQKPVELARPATPAAPVEPPKPDPKELERLTLRKKIIEGTSRDAVGRAFDRYAKSYGMPKDWELLERGLEHPRDERLAEVLSEIEALLEREKPRRTRTLDGRLRFIAETHDDTELRARAQAVRARLS